MRVMKPKNIYICFQNLNQYQAHMLPSGTKAKTVLLDEPFHGLPHEEDMELPPGMPDPGLRIAGAI
jgi:hypothetical protein